MAMSRPPTWLGFILLPVGLLFVAIPGMWVCMRTTAPRLHPNPHEVPSVTDSQPLGKFAGAAEQARNIVRAHLSEENLPGLSVAVGIGGDVVWAEGFGFADLRTSAPVTP